MKKILALLCHVYLMLGVGHAQTKAVKEEKKHSTEIIRYNIPADQQKAFETAYAQAEVYLKKSEFCLNYQVLHGEEEPQHYIVVIDWTSKEDHMNGFRKSAQFKQFFNLVKPFYNHIEEMKHYNAIDIFWKK
ncbi:MAG TPA: antibiotic biosynthesis monooxygenase family protein [Cytophagales bacterium]|nr:antibiotic biosynthesis monooxygenase family protein [Cytophagales bacterium]